MSSRVASLESVIEGVTAEGLVPAEASAGAEALVQRLGEVQPWYVRTMVGGGAWLASLLLIGFFSAFGLAFGGTLVLGLILMVAAVWLRRRPRLGANDFVVQCTLATSLAGQALFTWGLAESLDGELKLVCFIVIGLSASLFLVFPDHVHRVLMVLFGAAALTLLVYLYELNGAVPVLGPLFAGAVVLLYRRRAALVARGAGRFVRPLANGLALSAFGCLLLSTIYLLPDLGVDFSFYPRPWISTLLLGGLFLYLGSTTWPPLLEGRGRGATLAVHALMLVLIAASWSAPGLLLALTVVLLGAAAGHRSLVGAGIGFLVVFVAAYFYGIEVTMLQKSAALVGSGLATLVARQVLLGALGGRGDG